MEAIKKEKIQWCNDQVKAIKIIKAKGELTWDREKAFKNADIEVLLKWKKKSRSNPNGRRT
jgi:hypothetical protein